MKVRLSLRDYKVLCSAAILNLRLDLLIKILFLQQTDKYRWIF